MEFELVDNPLQTAVIKVIGVGGGGGNAVQHMLAHSLEGVDFIAANTDQQALAKVNAPTIVRLGSTVTKGLGAGANPEVGRQAAMEDRDRIKELLTGSNMVFITAGMGGGTGTGAAPVVAQIARELKILSVAVVTKPFEFENRTATAQQGIDELFHHVDSLIAVPNEKLLDVVGGDATLDEAFAAANDVLLGAVRGISDIIFRPGIVNVDFADVRTVMSEPGMAIMGTGIASGEDRAVRATHAAIHSPLLEDTTNLRGARGLLVNITTAPSIGMREYTEVGTKVRELAAGESTVVIGTAHDPDVGDEMRVTVVATGLGEAGPGPEIVVDNTEADDRPGLIRYNDLDRRALRQGGSPAGLAESDEDTAKYLDIPSFLRRQSD